MLAAAAALLVSFAASASHAEPVPLHGIAGVTFRSGDLVRTRRYYGTQIGFRELAARNGGARFGVGGAQWIEFLPGYWRDYTVRFVSLTLTTPSLRELEAKLRARGVTPSKRPGGKALEFRDPAGHLLVAVEATGGGGLRPAPGFSQHLQHIGLVVNHEQEREAMAFYGEVLGLEEVFRLNDQSGHPILVKYKLAGQRFDVIELIHTAGPMNKWAAGSAYHVNFAVDDIERAYCDLFRRGVTDRDAHMPKVNGERLWAIDMIDPELLRVEIQVPAKAAQEIGTAANPSCAAAGEALRVSGGKSLAGWSGEEGLWRVENGVIVGDAKAFMHGSSYLWHDTAVLKDFYLSVWVKQTPSRNRGAGIQFRGVPVDWGSNPGRGYQAGIGSGAWGRLYHEKGREHLVRTDAGEKAVDWDGWNHYEILAVGHRIWTAVNGTLSVSAEDPKGELAGRLALQIRPGGPQEVRFRDLQLVRNPPVSLAGLDEAALVARLAPVVEEKVAAKPR